MSNIRYLSSLSYHLQRAHENITIRVYRSKIGIDNLISFTYIFSPIASPKIQFPFSLHSTRIDTNYAAFRLLQRALACQLM